MQHEICNTGSGWVKIANEEDVALTSRGENKGKAKKGASSYGAKRNEKKKKKIWICPK